MTFWVEETSSLVVKEFQMMVTIFLGKLRLLMHKKSLNSADSGQIIKVIGEFIEFDQIAPGQKSYVLW